MNLYNERYFVAPYNMPPNPKGVGLTFISDRNPTSRKKDMSNQVVPGIAHSLAKVTRGMHGQYVPMEEEFFFRKYHLSEQELGRDQFEGRLKYPYTSKENILHKSLPRITLVGNNYYYPPSRVYIQRRLDTVTNSLETHFFDLMGVYLDDMDPTQRSMELGKLYNKAYMGRPGLLNFLSQYLQDHFCVPISRANPRGIMTQSTRIRQQVKPNPIPGYAFTPGTWFTTVPTTAGVGAVGGGPIVPPPRGPPGAPPRGPPGAPPRGPPGAPPGAPPVAPPAPPVAPPRGPTGGRPERFFSSTEFQNDFMTAFANFTVNGGGAAAFVTTAQEETKTNEPTMTQAEIFAQHRAEIEALLTPAQLERIRQRREAAEARGIQSAGTLQTLNQPTHNPTGMAAPVPPGSITPQVPSRTMVQNLDPLDDEGSPSESVPSANPPEIPLPEVPIPDNITKRRRRLQKTQNSQLNRNILVASNRILSSFRENESNAPFSDMLTVLMNDINSNLEGSIPSILDKEIRDDVDVYQTKRQKMLQEDAIDIEQMIRGATPYEKAARLQEQELRLSLRFLEISKKEELERGQLSLTDPSQERIRSASFLDLNEHMIKYAKATKDEATLRAQREQAAKLRQKQRVQNMVIPAKEVPTFLEEEPYIRPLSFYMGVIPTCMTDLPQFRDVVDFSSLGYLYEEKLRQEHDNLIGENLPIPFDHVPLIHATLFASQLKYMFYRATPEFEEYTQSLGRPPTVSDFYSFLSLDPEFIRGADFEGQESVERFFTQPSMGQKPCADIYEDGKTLLFCYGLMSSKSTENDKIKMEIRDFLDSV